jgi:hypothetical protein
MSYDDEPIMDFEWLDSENVVLMVKKAIGVVNLSHASDRPYSSVVTTGCDFSAFDQLAFVNDKLIPD